MEIFKSQLFKITLVIIFLSIFLFFYSSLKEIIFINFLVEIYNNFKSFISENILFSAFLAIIFFCTWVFLLLPFVSLIQIFFGFIFDIYLGFFINYFSLLLGSFLIFLLIKYKIISKIKYFKEIKETLNKYNKYLHNKFLFIFLVRLLPGVPFMLQNVLAAFIKTDTKIFLIASILGLWPIVLINTYFGSTIQLFTENINFKTNLLNPYILSGVIIYTLIIFYKFAYKK